MLCSMTMRIWINVYFDLPFEWTSTYLNIAVVVMEFCVWLTITGVTRIISIFGTHPLENLLISQHQCIHLRHVVSVLMYRGLDLIVLLMTTRW